MSNLPVCRLLCLCGAIIRLYGSTNGAQQQHPGFYQLTRCLEFSINFTYFCKKYLSNLIDQWSLIDTYSNSPFVIFWVGWVSGRRQTHFDVRFVVDCLTFPSVNISSCLQPKCSPQEMQDGRFEKLIKFHF